MSTLQVGTIKSASSAAPVFQNSSGVEKGQLCKLWLDYNGSTNTILDDFNVSTVGDDGTGLYTVNWSNSAANVNYCPVFGSIHTSGVVLSRGAIRDPGQVTKSTSSFRLEVFNTAGANVDVNRVNVACFGA
tara:strand:+ start:24 stop:416 length:393 start_codon:yes stop_codon:yes gene_type:complete